MVRLLTFIGHSMINDLEDFGLDIVSNETKAYQRLRNFFKEQPSISLSDLSREIGKNRNYINNILKSNVVTEKQAKKLLPYLQKYGYAEDVL